MFLSKLRLNPLSRDVQRDLSDVVALHRSVMRGFSDVDDASPRSHHGVLHRLELDVQTGRVTLIVQSRSEPSWSGLPERYLVADGHPSAEVTGLTNWLGALEPGMSLRFRLRANPTRRVRASGEGHRSGPRVELRGDVARLAWLQRHATRSGFRLPMRGDDPEARVFEEPKLYGWQIREGTRRRVVVAPCLFEGLVVVEDPGALREVVCRGIGSAKAYGMGLLSLAKA